MSKNQRQQTYDMSLDEVKKLVHQSRNQNRDARISWLQEVSKLINIEIDDAFNPEHYFQEGEGLAESDL